MQIELDLKGVSQAPEKAYVEITKIIRNSTSPDRPMGGFGTRQDTGEAVFIGGRCVEGADLIEGDVELLTMCINDRWLKQQSDAKWFAYYAHIEEEPEEEEPEQEEEAAERAAAKNRDAEFERADRLMSAGGVWNVVDISNAVLRTSYRTTTEMTKEHLRISAALNMHFEKLHRDGRLAKLEMRQKAGQQRASHVFFTKYPGKLAEALRGKR